MEITGSFPVPAPYSGTNQTGNYPQRRPQTEEQPRPPATVIQQTTRPQADYETERKRVYPTDKDLPYSAQTAINSYIDSDFAGGPELMNRVDVYA